MEKFFDSGWAKLAIGVIGMGGVLYAHCNNNEIHKTQSELLEMFVSRAEYKANFDSLKEDIKWIKAEMVRNTEKLDRLAERK